MINYTPGRSENIAAAGDEMISSLARWIADGVCFRELRVCSLIVANLTPTEYNAFQNAHISYSGATGAGAIAGYEPYGPYIATSFTELSRVMEVLGWKHVKLTRHAAQFIVQHLI